MPPPELLELRQGLGQPHHPCRMEMQGLELGPAETAAQIKQPIEIIAGPSSTGQKPTAPSQDV